LARWFEDFLLGKEMAKRISSRLRAEMWDQMQFFVRKVADQQVRCVISLDGRIDENRMTSAVRLSLDAVPVMGFRYVEGWWRPSWRHVEQIDDSKICTIIESENVEHDILSFLSEEIDPFEGPQARVRILRSTTDRLCINMNHMVGDSAGLKEYVYLLASIYRNLIEDPDYRPEPNAKGRRDLRQVSKHIRLRDKIRILRRGAAEAFRSLNWRFPLGQGACKREIVILKFSRDRFNAIREYGKRHQATLNDVVLTAYYRALFEVIRPDPSIFLRVAVTVDLRRYIPSGEAEAIGNLSAFIFSEIGSGLGANFEETLIKVRDDMNTKKNDFPGLQDFPRLIVLFKLLPYSVLKRKILRRLELTKMAKPPSSGMPPSLTNTGIIDSEKLVFGDVGVNDAYLAGAINYSPGFQMGVSSFKETMTCSVCFCDTGEDKKLVDRFFACLEKELPK
jgi:NRPS condensation-like uncharacterized protein